jgi:hypothetical protein
MKGVVASPTIARRGVGTALATARQQAIAEDRRLVDEGMRHHLERRPEWRLPQLGDHLVRDADQVRLEVFDGVASSPGRHQVAKPGRMIGRPSRLTLADHQW